MPATVIRTLIRAEIDNIVIPAWDFDIHIPMTGRTDIPEAVQKRIKAGKTYFHARVNLEAVRADDIVFSDWEDQ